MLTNFKHLNHQHPPSRLLHSRGPRRKGTVLPNRESESTQCGHWIIIPRRRPDPGTWECSLTWKGTLWRWPSIIWEGPLESQVSLFQGGRRSVPGVGDAMTETEAGGMCSEDRGSSHNLRNVGGRWKPKKERKQILPQKSLEGISPTDTLLLTQWDQFWTSRNWKITNLCCFKTRWCFNFICQLC